MSSVASQCKGTQQCGSECESEAGAQSGCCHIADGHIGTGNQPGCGFVSQSDQQSSQWRVIGQEFGGFEYLSSNIWCEEQWSVLFECLCEVDSLQNIEGLVNCQSWAIWQGRICESWVDE